MRAATAVIAVFFTIMLSLGLWYKIQPLFYADELMTAAFIMTLLIYLPVYTVYQVKAVKKGEDASTGLAFFMTVPFLLVMAISLVPQKPLPSTLDKFALIGNRGQHSNERLSLSNGQLYEMVVHAGKLQSLDSLRLLREKTREIIELISVTKEKIVEAVGGYTFVPVYGYDDTEMMKGAYNTQEQLDYMLGKDGKNDGCAYQLEALIDQQMALAQALCAEIDYNKLVFYWVSPSQNYVCNSFYEKIDFAHIRFEKATTFGALAMLTQIETDALMIEQQAVLSLLK